MIELELWRQRTHLNFPAVTTMLFLRGGFGFFILFHRDFSPCPACCGFREGRRTLYPLYTLGQLSYLTDSGAPRIESHDYQRPIARLFTA